MTLEDAKRQYRKAWEEYRTNFDLGRKKELEDMMDQAQNHFSWNEFKEFEVTLDGFVEYWGFLKQKGMEAIKKMEKKNE